MHARMCQRLLPRDEVRAAPALRGMPTESKAVTVVPTVIRTFPWTRYNGAQVQIRSSKTGKLLWIPATRELRDHLDGLLRTGALVMLTPSGKAYTRRYFNEHWREDCDLVDAANAEVLGPDAEFVRTAGLNFHDNPRHGRDAALRSRRNAAGGCRGALLDRRARAAHVRGLHGPPRRDGRQRHHEARGVSRADGRFSVLNGQ